MPPLKGAFLDVQAGLAGTLPNIVVFQFNPENISRTPTLVRPPPTTEGSGNRDSTQQPGEPSESISFSLRIDATDQLTGQRGAQAARYGILPTLSALELLMLQQRQRTPDLARLSGSRSVAVHPPVKIPTVLFFWGKWRILPVSIKSLNIIETAFDTRLNPVRAEVSVSLEVLAPAQIAKEDTLGLEAYQYTQKLKAQLSALNTANALDIGVSPSQAIAF